MGLCDPAQSVGRPSAAAYSREARRFRSTSWTTPRSAVRPIRTQACTPRPAARLDALPEEAANGAAPVSVEGLPYAEVAAVVGVPLGTVMCAHIAGARPSGDPPPGG